MGLLTRSEIEQQQRKSEEVADVLAQENEMAKRRRMDAAIVELIQEESFSIPGTRPADVSKAIEWARQLLRDGNPVDKVLSESLRELRLYAARKAGMPLKIFAPSAGLHRLYDTESEQHYVLKVGSLNADFVAELLGYKPENKDYPISVRLRFERED